MEAIVDNIIKKYRADSNRLMDILIDVQDELSCLPDKVVKQIAQRLGISKVDVEQTTSFYHFFSRDSRGKYTIYLNNSAIANMMGRERVARELERLAGCAFGQVSKDGLIGLFDTACIGMNDQEPAAIINGRVFTHLTAHKVRHIIKGIKEGRTVDDLVNSGWGDGNNDSPLMRSTVQNNVRLIGPILADDHQEGEAVRKIVGMTPEQVIEEVKKSNIRGRGGAGFPTALKWEFCRRAKGKTHYVFCNADEGEPGTFKDRVILTERPRLVLEGMVVAAYAIGGGEGIVYLRYEYNYMRKHLESTVEQMRQEGLLGKNIAGKEGFDFDIRIQSGAGAYVCGEESALIESAEGKRGEPRDRPPFPVEKGYLGQPTVVNNVETFCAAAKIILKGGDWYSAFGTKDSTGTKLLCVSGDCQHPGVYEVEWGFNIYDILDMVGADPEMVQAVQVGGPSGTCVSRSEFKRVLCYSDLATGGSLMIIGRQRDLLRDVILNFMDFFIDESCGSCVPCRSLTVLYRNKLKKILDGHGVEDDLRQLQNWASVMKSNRCGLGQSAANPILSSLRNFRNLYEKLLVDKKFNTAFNLEAAMQEGLLAANRQA